MPITGAQGSLNIITNTNKKDTHIVLLPDVIAALLVLDQFVVLGLAATEQVQQMNRMYKKSERRPTEHLRTGVQLNKCKD